MGLDDYHMGAVDRRLPSRFDEVAVCLTTNVQIRLAYLALVRVA